MVARLIRKIRLKPYIPDEIIGIATGAWPMIRSFKDAFPEADAQCIRISHYKDVGEKGQLLFHRAPTYEESSLLFRGKKVLIIDDLVDTGRTMDSMYQLIDQADPSDIKVAVLFWKDEATWHPDFYIQKAPTDQWWIVFHYEAVEFCMKYITDRRSEGIDDESIAHDLKFKIRDVFYHQYIDIALEVTGCQ
jgi:hypoxanthine phosphoribosyltransferase